MATLIAYMRADPTLDIPNLPASWDIVPADNRWSTVYPNGRGDRWFNARMIARTAGQPNRAVFVCTGRRNVLDKLATKLAEDAQTWTRTWDRMSDLRNDVDATAVAIRAAWPDERPDGAGTLVALWARMAGELGEDGET